MNLYYITGTSKGIGKAVAEALLEDEQNKVVGISRSVTIEHPNYQHEKLDLNNLYGVSTFNFGLHDTIQKVVLINNAAMLATVKHVGGLENEKIIKGINVNLIAPLIFMNNFINTYKDLAAEKMIINVSSGAGKNPVDGWGVYCNSENGRRRKNQENF